MEEFRKGALERRPDRRVCRRCETLCGDKKTCPKCGAQAEPRIQIYWFVGSQRNRKLTTCWREAEASKVLQRIESDYWRTQELGVDRDIGGTLEDARDEFLADLNGCSANYRKQVGTALKALAAGVGWGQQVHLIGKQDIKDFRRDGLNSRSPATVRSYMLVLRRFFGWLHDEGWIRRNPTRKITLPNRVEKKDCLFPTEVGPVLDVFWEKWPQLAPITTTFMLGGWRKGEVVNLRRRDVNLDEGWAYVLDFEGSELEEAWEPKTRSSVRAVALHPLVVTALRQVEPVMRSDGEKSPWMFPVTDPRKRERYRDAKGRLNRAYGDRRSPTTTFFGKKLSQALTIAGVNRKVTVHGLRRTFSVLLQEAGAPDSVIAEALGHKARGVTHAHYLPRRNDLVKRWVDAIEVHVEALRPGSTPSAKPAHPPHIPQSGKHGPPGLRLVKPC